jgi:EAL domain-containing protein (putative c-di-GMP-specific phosphodiesterase class I)
MEIADLGAINRQIGPARCDELLRGLYRPIEEAAVASGGFAGRWTGALVIAVAPLLPSETARKRLASWRARSSRVLKEFGIDRSDRIYCGGVEASGTQATLRALVRSAEEALLQARESPDGIVVVDAARPAGDAAAAEDDAVAMVRDALGARRVHLVGQVVYRMSDHRPLHTEIMARLRDASGREIAAAQFMPIVAAHGLGDEFDRGVIERVIEAARGRQEAISINVSMRSVERPEFAEWLARLLKREPALARRLVFELAEHGVVQNEAAAAAFSGTVSKAGAGFAIDHFGVHRDSLALVQRLRPVYIKLAGAHTPSMVTEAGARFFAESLVGAARQLDIPVIAQMVEDDETFQSLGSLGFAGYQGNLIGRPAPWPRS